MSLNINLKNYLLIFLFSTALLVITLLFGGCSAEKICKLKYIAGEGGTVLGAVIQNVERGNDGEEVRAVPDTGYYFKCWSDGLETSTRKDYNVKSSGSFVAQFEPLPKCTITYLAAEGGAIYGETEQSVSQGLWYNWVDAIAYGGYEFVGWDDGVTTERRWDKAESDKTVTAIFKRIEYTVNYVANVGGRISGNASQIVRYGDSSQAVTAVADYGYEFIGWSDGVQTATRQDVSVKNNLDVRAIFANDSEIRFPILMVFCTELHADLELNNGEMFRADYVMTDEERAVYEIIPLKFAGILNDLFAGEVVFEVDSYYTTQPFGRENLYQGTDMWHNYEYGTEISRIPEISEMVLGYRSVLTTIFLDDKFHTASGTAIRKSACVYADSFLSVLYEQGESAEFLLDIFEPSVQKWWDSIMETYLHEFTHTAEMYYAYGDSDVLQLGLHSTIEYYYINYKKSSIEAITDYVKGQAFFDGKYIGIPMMFWQKEPNY